MFRNEKEQIISEWSDADPDELISGRPDVWRVHIPSVPSSRLDHVLSEQEKNRAERYKFDKDRKSYTVSRAALRLILGNYLKENPQKLNFSYNAYGKPSIESPANRKIFFNVSHSGEYALIAASSDAELGIDLELMRELDYLDLAEHFFSDREQTEIKKLPTELLKKGFYTVWTRKEAFIKAIGLGLSFPLKEFDVSISPHEIPPIRFHQSQTVFDTGWEVRDIPTENQYCASLVIPARNYTKIRIFDFDWRRFT
jgi:4'-phosphopantetheinyl transferase